MKNRKEKKGYAPYLWGGALLVGLALSFYYDVIQNQRPSSPAPPSLSLPVPASPAGGPALPPERESSAMPSQEEGMAHPEGADQLFLQVPLEATERERAIFLSEFRRYDPYDSHKLRLLYEEYIDVLGANGILEVIQTVHPTCHSEGHPLGMVIYAKLRQIGPALETCQEGCYSGCMHGVFMEAFKGSEGGDHPHSPTAVKGSGPRILTEVKAILPTLCYGENVTRSYRAGDCAHGAGHALMYILDYDIPRVIEHCKLFDTEVMDYYCATGAYMEYVTTHDREDSRTRPLLYPCDTAEYPAACFRYKMVHVFQRHYKAGRRLEGIVKECMALDGKYRLGCFHGLGNAHMGLIAFGKMRFPEVCHFGTEDDQYVCIDGAIERMSKYHPQKAQLRCQDLEGWQRELCFAGAARGMYSLDKSFKFYIQ